MKLLPQSHDVMIMNPPFARTSFDNLMFGIVENKKFRAEMQLQQEIGFRRHRRSKIEAGFLSACRQVLSIRRRISFVLPRNLPPDQLKPSENSEIQEA